MKVLAHCVRTAPFAVLLLAAGCAYQDDSGPGGGNDGRIGNGAETTEQGVTIRTRFVVEGLDGLRDVTIDRLFLHVGAILLEPIDDERDGVTFANSLPFELDFDLEGGESEITGPEMDLPFGGEYAVSLQLEPSFDIQQAGDLRKLVASDATVEVLGSYVQRVTIDSDDLCQDDPTPLPWRQRSDDDDPTPLPWQERSDEDDPTPLPWHEATHPSNGRTLAQVVDFVYRSDRIARFYLADIRLAGAGTYELTLTLQLGEWIIESVLPAVESAAGDPFDVRLLGDEDEAGMDNLLEAENDDLDALLGDIGVDASSDEPAE